MSITSPKWRRRVMARLLKEQDGKCFYCSRTIQKNQPNDSETKENTATFDHLVPRCAGGKSTQDNLVAACFDCNNAKGARMPQHMIHPSIFQLVEAMESAA